MLIKNNLKNFNNALDIWNESNLAVRIYLNILTGEIMCFQYENLNSWEVFNSDSIKEIMTRPGIDVNDDPFEYILDENEFLDAINYSLGLTNTDDYILLKYVKKNNKLKKRDLDNLEMLFLYEE
ncbi:hypothetical protein [Peptoniphilus timonensis]|uniref:hypothetical protein n=1 Tax=Peptoniphilus timonensis TaxID=1268254 RepID=UPI0003068E73|nr:hypothetical protein [Peptoniphilus timonensis]